MIISKPISQPIGHYSQIAMYPDIKLKQPFYAKRLQWLPMVKAYSLQVLVMGFLNELVWINCCENSLS